MNFRWPKHGMSRVLFIFVGFLSVMSISATYVLASETLFLPLIGNQGSPLSPTTTLIPTATVSPSPQPPGTIQLLVTLNNSDKDWALAYFAKSYNDAGRPVMQIYPGDNSLDSERIKIPKGTMVLALETPVTADGGGKFWQLVEYKGRRDETLYLRAADVTKLTLTEPG